MNNVSSSGFYLKETTALLFQNCIIVAFVFLFDKQSDFIKKGHSQLWDRATLDTSFLTLKKGYLNPKSKLRVECI